MKRAVPALFAACLAFAFAPFASAGVIPAPRLDAPAANGMQTAVFAGGCFWGVQAVFQHVKGVTKAVSGYAGGGKMSASYEVVSTGLTGHAESVEVTFNPKQVSYGKLLQVFFSVAHDPTQVNRQGPDRGTQYRSAIFTTNDDQAKVARAYIVQLDSARTFDAPIATKVDPLKGFYAAEAYHQDYLVHHPDQLYIVINDIPKVKDLKASYPALWREKPVLVNPDRAEN